MRRNSFSQRFCRLLNETIVFFFHNSIGYAIMLSVMMYSGWLFLAVIIGMSLGYFLFGHITMKINMENVHLRKTSTACPSSCPEVGVSGMGKWNFLTILRDDHGQSTWVCDLSLQFQQVKLHRRVQPIRANCINHSLLPMFHQIHAMKIKSSVKRVHRMNAMRMVSIHRQKLHQLKKKTVVAVYKTNQSHCLFFEMLRKRWLICANINFILTKKKTKKPINFNESGLKFIANFRWDCKCK